MNERDRETEERIRTLAEDLAAAGYARDVASAVNTIVDTITSSGPPIRAIGTMLPSRWHPIRRRRARREFLETVARMRGAS